MRETIDWRDELQRLVELYREELGEEIATFLLSIPTMARLPLGKLARIGKEAGWGEVTMGYNLCVPKSVSPNEALLHIYESPSVSSLGSEYLEVNYQHYTLRFSTGDSRLWRIAYYTVLAWHQEHTPELPEPTLPTDPAKCLDVFCEQIEQTNGGGDFNMALLHTTLQELGVPDILKGYRIPDRQDAQNAEFGLAFCLSQIANNSSACIAGTPVTLEFSTRLNYYCVDNLPEPMIKACQALIARRNRLYILCPK